MRRRKIRILPLLLLLAGVVGFGSCKKGVKAPEELADVTEEEGTALGKSLEEALNSCDSKALNSLVDMEAAVRMAIRQSKTPKNIQGEVLKGMLDSLDEEMMVAFCGANEENSFSRFLRTRKREGRLTALIRQSSAEGINYLEFYVGKRKGGQVVSDNFYIYLAGTSIVETFRAPLDGLVANPEAADSFARVIDLMDSNPAAGLAALKSLPAELRDTKMLQIGAVQAASLVGDEAYVETITHYEKLFPNDASLDLVSIDGLVLTKKFDMALAATDRLDKALGGDPYLDQLRAGILIQQETDFPRAVTLAKSAIKVEPEDVDSYNILLVAELGSKNYAGAVEVMTTLTDKFEYLFDESSLSELTVHHEELVKSPEWVAYKTANPPTE